MLKRIWLPKTSSKKSMIITTPLQSLEKKGCPVLIMHGFKDSIGAVYQQFSGYHQHDSQEFLRHLINSIHSELLYPKNPKANNYVAAEYRSVISRRIQHFTTCRPIIICPIAGLLSQANFHCNIEPNYYLE